MSESNDYDPGPWKGHNFASARRAYDDHVNRSYADAVSNKKTTADVLPTLIATESGSPLTIVSDVTGSMGEWPAVMFSKLPYLDLEGKQYLGQDMQICFAAVGDATCDDYPLQFRPFATGLPLKDELAKLVIEGGGGGQSTESYELAALYLARNFLYTKLVRMPIVIFIGDEQPYSLVNPDLAKRCANVLIQQKMSDKDIFSELMQTHSVYLVRKPYSHSSEEPGIMRHWVSLLGEDHIAMLPDASRIVDVIFGILAAEVNRIDYFHQEIEDRQRPDQVDTVYRSLATIHASASKHSGKSMMIRPRGGTMSKSLLD